MSWRLRQLKFFSESVIFEQDARIKSFFKNSATEDTFYHGDIDYFKEIKFSKKKKRYNQCLLIFNKLIEKDSLIKILKKYKNKKLNKGAKVCICINKFQIFSNNSDKKIKDNYDQALYNIIFDIFFNCKIEYFFIKNLKGDHFNFASPTSQFFFKYKTTNENN
jgi:hypothetical protein